MLDGTAIWSLVTLQRALRRALDGLTHVSTHERTKSHQKSMEYFSMIHFAVDCYAEVAASRIYPDQPAIRNWTINGYMLAWRGDFLRDQEGEEHMERNF